ncbi:NAD(P)-binding domain-containing protein [Streptomyces sp. NPDC091212]|uniref:NAD(P)-binding domain-containing protein n=1 Tax=Streptomyces sp. NPDC091212 TaxID=3155191 RepID=UPI0034444111
MNSPARTPVPGDRVPLVLVSETDLLDSGLWDHTSEIVLLTERTLRSRSQGWRGKAVLAPSNEQTAELLQLSPEARHGHLGLDFDYKLNVLAALSREAAGFKAVGANALNRSLGLSRACALYVLYDPATMRPTALVRSTLLSSLRTAAYACIVRERCRAQVVAILGSGDIARTLARLWAHLDGPGPREVRICSPHLRAAAVTAAIGPTPYRLVTTRSPEDAVKGADLLVTATTAATPVFSGSWLNDDIVHVNLGGHEAPLAFVEQCARGGTLIADDLAGTLRRGVQSLAVWWAGQDPAPTGIPVHDFTTDSWDTLERPWHVNCVGRADLDVALAQWALSLAQHAGHGQSITL